MPSKERRSELMNKFIHSDRRSFLDAVGKTGAGLILTASAAGIAGAQGKKSKVEKKAGDKPEDVGPTEDLMREHGVLNRVLLVYDHFIYQIDQKQDYKAELVTGAASIIRSFVEDYHERQEEQFLFPRFVKAGVLADLTPCSRPSTR